MVFLVAFSFLVSSGVDLDVPFKISSIPNCKRLHLVYVKFLFRKSVFALKRLHFCGIGLSYPRVVYQILLLSKMTTWRWGYW